MCLTHSLDSQDSPRHAVEDAAGAVEFGEALFFFAKFARVRDESATGAPRGMLDVEHFVKQHILDGALRNARMIQAAVQQNLVRARIVAAKLPPPGAQAPADVRPLQFAAEVFRV